MEKSEEDQIVDQICEYAEKSQIKALLQEYLKRLVLEKPEDPLEFLIKSISSDPFVPPVVSTENS
jgi:hypothetical protein